MGRIRKHQRKQHWTLLALWLLLCTTACTHSCTSTDQPAHHGSGLLAAHQIDNPEDLIGGTDPVGGLGDWYLANDRVEIIIDDVNNQNLLAPAGGTLVDFAVRGKDNDQFNQMFQIFLLSHDIMFLYENISATRDTTLGMAQISVWGHLYNANPPNPVTAPPGAITAAVAAQIRVRTEYTLYDGDPILHVTSTLTNDSNVILNGALGAPITDVFVWGERSVMPFAPYELRGFEHPPFNVSNPAPSVGFFPFIAAHSEASPAVSYGVVGPSTNDGLVTGINTEEFTAVGQPLWSPPVKPGESITYARDILISDTLSVQSIADQAYRVLDAEASHVLDNKGLGTLQGTLNEVPPGRAVQIIAEQIVDGYAVTAANATRLTQAGDFEFTLPEGTYQLKVMTGRAAPMILGPYDVRADALTTVPNIAGFALATLSFSITDGTQGIPSRLTITGVGPTPDPIMGPIGTGPMSGNVAYTQDGTGTVALEPGTYDVYASRGITYSLAHQQITVAPGDHAAVSLVITQVVDTTGYVGGDFHVHSAGSFDSSLDHPSRVLSYAAEGVDLMVSTDHDFIVDYAPTIRAMGLQNKLTSMIGVESTGVLPTARNPFTIGHNNAWPLTMAPNLPRAGAPRDERIEPAELYDRIRAIAPSATPVIQLNHPRAHRIGNAGFGYFDNMYFQPTSPIPDQDDHGINSFFRRKSPVSDSDNLSFDAMEILSGVDLDSVMFNQQNRADWFALLKQGIVRTGMANSDSHQLSRQPAGTPRSFVRYTATTLNGALTIDPHTFNQAILQQRVMGTNGPFIDVSVQAPEGVPVHPSATQPVSMGEQWVMAPGADRILLTVRVQAAPWIPVNEIRIVVNGTVVRRLATTPPGEPFGTTGVVRFSGNVELPISTDSFIVIEAGAPLPVASDLDGDGVLDTWDSDGDGDADQQDADLGGSPIISVPVILDAIVPEMLPWGFTNPIFVDHDGNGWQAPGL